MALNGKLYQYKFTDGSSNPHLYVPTEIESTNYTGKVNGFTIGTNVPADAKFTDTTYTFATGDSNGQIKVTPSSGNATNVYVKGLGSAAYTESSAYATSGHTHNYAGSDSAGGAANTLKNFRTSTTTNLGIDTTTAGGAVGYVSGLTSATWNYNHTDGALYSHTYNSNWEHQIYGDYRTGQISIRGKNNGTWQNWRRILDETNYTSIITKSGLGLGNVEDKSSATIRGEITSSNVTTALGYTPVNKAGDTMSSSLNITKAGETGVEVDNTAQSHKVGFIVGSSGNAGIYDRTKSKWVVYSTTAGDVVLNGNANTATTATNV